MTDAADLATPTSPVAPAVSAWEDPPRGEPADGAPVLSIDGFAGPLDWLLEMARAKKIDLARLSIGALIEAFARAMQAALAGRDRSRIGHWAAWTVMAATLTELRSRLLLPADAPAARAAAEEAEALRRQLLARAQMRLAADWLERRPQLGREVFARGMPELSPTGRVGDLTELLRACLVALRVPEEQAAAFRPRPPPLWRASDALPRLRQLLGVLPDGSPLAAFLPQLGTEEPDSALRARAALSSTLIAGLELARDGVLALDQDTAWTPVRVRRHEDRTGGRSGISRGPDGEGGNGHGVAIRRPSERLGHFPAEGEPTTTVGLMHSSASRRAPKILSRRARGFEDPLPPGTNNIEASRLSASVGAHRGKLRSVA